ncbi:MAG TPA: D-glycerate dehydrogenase [Bacillota bacterium]|nr:D-glycerate dehydrogenase [Bacillota bacterium]
MQKPRVYITRKLPEYLLEPYASKFDFRVWHKEDEPVPRDVLLEEIQHADGLLCMLTEQIDDELLEAGRRLKVVANLAVGYDNIDVETAHAKGVVVTNTPDVLSETTADLTLALLMATARRIVEANDLIRRDYWRNWSPFLLAGTDIHHKTIGIVGMGRIGQAVARRAKGFGMKILYHNRSRNYKAERALDATYVTFDELLRESDYVVSMVPLTDETVHMFNRDAFQKMKPTAIFINTSRGGVMDEEALYEALQQKDITAAGLDVFETEPIRADHPLLELDNVVCLPHIGSASVETRTNMVTLCLDNLQGVLYGNGPKTPVTLSPLEK